MGEGDNPIVEKPIGNNGSNAFKVISTQPNNLLLAHDFKIEELSTKLEELRGKFEKQLSYDKASLITVFGIFASIVTFLSVEVQAFKSICDPIKLLGFSIFILASLLTFIFVLHLIANFWINEKVKEYPRILLICVILLFLGGALAFFLGKDENYCKDNIIFSRYSDDFNNRQADLEKQIKNEIHDSESGVISNIGAQKNAW